MTFGDNDLKLLKTTKWIPATQVLALLARMEAAEEALGRMVYAYREGKEIELESLICGDGDLYSQWRKAAGK